MQTATVLVTVAMTLEIDTDRPVVKLAPSVLEEVRSKVASEIIAAGDEEAFEDFGLGHYFANVDVVDARLAPSSGSNSSALEPIIVTVSGGIATVDAPAGAPAVHVIDFDNLEGSLYELEYAGGKRDILLAPAEVAWLSEHYPVYLARLRPCMVQRVWETTDIFIRDMRKQPNAFKPETVVEYVRDLAHKAFLAEPSLRAETTARRTLADPLPPAVAAAVQSWWHTDPRAVDMVKNDQTLSLSLTAARVALTALDAMEVA